MIKTSYTHKLSWLLIAVVLVILSAMVMSPVAHAKTVKGAIKPFICTEYCMIVKDITLSGKYPVTLPQITAVVTVQDSASGAVVGAKVYGYWIMPSAGQIKPVTVVGTTNEKGQVIFRIPNKTGEFTFTITNVVREKMVFDRWNSVLSKSIK